MRALFCEATQDISYFVNRAESDLLKRDLTGCYVLSAETERIDFGLMNVDDKLNYMAVRMPQQPSISKPYCFVMINEKAYQNLVNDGICSSRQTGGSKITVILDDELAALPSEIKNH